MPLPRRLLNEGEVVVVDVRPHWWYLAGPMALFVVTIAGAIAAAVGKAPSWANWAALAGLLLAGLWLVFRYARWATTDLAVTTSRIIQRRGILGRSGREIPLAALTDISYHQSLFERIIGTGDVLLESAGREGHEVFPDLPKPGRIQNEIARQCDQARARAAGGSPTGASIPMQIEQLDSLRRRGIISDSEFEAKKTELLNRL